MNKEGKMPQTETLDVNALTEELNTLKMAYTDLTNKYGELETTHKTYKFDIEFKEDIKDIKTQVSDKDIEVLKKLKISNNDEAYKLLLDRYTIQGHNYLSKDIDGRFSPVNYTPRGGSMTVSDGGDLFTSAINEVKGE